jgi:hypothetical protein
MEISFSRFAQLTTLIAAGGSVAIACTVEQVEGDEKTKGAADGGTGYGVGGAHIAQAGASSGLGGLGGVITQGGSVGNSVSVAGAPSAGEASVAGNAGSPASAGSPGSATNHVSVAGQSSASGGAGNYAGASSAGAPSCVTSDPVEEGTGFDCSTLHYYEEVCPDPWGEGTVSVYGAHMCEFYASGRTESFKTVAACLSALTAPADGWCGAEHEAQVESCRQRMAQMTCVSSSVQAQCATYHDECPALSVQACEAVLSALSDEAALSLDPCIEGLSNVPLACAVKFRSCTSHVDHLISVDAACAELKTSCSDIDLASCRTALDERGTGTISESAARVHISQCIYFSRVFYGETCAEGFASCTS